MTKVRAHNCEVVVVDSWTESEFLNENHYQGYVPSSVCYGLIYDTELVMLMSFGKPRYNKRYNSELLRLCTRKGYQVYGGASKLFKEILAREDLGSIVSYCNEDLFNGKVYEALGFTKKTLTKGYHYEKDGRSYSRQSFQKWRCLQIWPEFVGQNITEREIMQKKGYTRVDDTVGQSTWVYGVEYKWYIYKIEIGPYVYIGQHKYIDINEPYFGSGTILKRAQKSYKTLGTKTILHKEIASQEEANKLEMQEIAYAREHFNCINILDGGTGYVKTKRKYVSQGHPHTDEWKEMQSKVMKAKWASGEFSGTRGMTHNTSEETKQKISEANKGRVVSEEARQHMSEAHIGNKQSEESIKKRSETLKRLVAEGKHKVFEKGHIMSDDVKAKISASMKGRKPKGPEAGAVWWTNGSINKRVKECPGPEWKRGRV